MKGNHQLLNQIKAEINQGIFARVHIFVIPLMIGVMYTSIYFRQIIDNNYYYNTGQKVSFGDCLIYLFKGMREYTPDILGSKFEIPIQFLLFNIVIAIIIGNYTSKDLHQYGMQKMIRCKSKSVWWFSKCIWNISSIICSYLALYVGVIITCIINVGVIDMDAPIIIHRDVMVKIFSCNNQDLNIEEILIMVLVLPLITSIAMSMLQMTIELFVFPIVSYIVVISIYVFSAFYMCFFMPGNFMMVYRYNQICDRGVELGTSIIVDMIIIMTVYLIGHVKIRKYDILDKE